MFDDFFSGFNVNSVLGFIGSERRNRAQQELAEQQMAFQERMSSTAHQREVADLRAAGLNPMLSLRHGGASSPGGAMAQLENSGAAASQSALVAEQVKNLKAQTLKATEEAGVARAQADHLDTETMIKKEVVPHGREHAELDVLKKRQEMYLRSYQMNVAAAANEGKVPHLLAEKVDQEVQQIKQEIRRARSQEDLNRAHEKLLQLDVPKGLAYSDFFKSPVGRMEPYLHSGSQAVGAAIGLRRLTGGIGLKRP